jgi:hypothetical protein
MVSITLTVPLGVAVVEAGVAGDPPTVMITGLLGAKPEAVTVTVWPAATVLGLTWATDEVAVGAVDPGTVDDEEGAVVVVVGFPSVVGVVVTWAAAGATGRTRAAATAPAATAAANGRTRVRPPDGDGDVVRSRLIWLQDCTHATNCHEVRPSGGPPVATVPPMDDREVIAAFVSGGARRAFGPTLHIEGDCLFFDGWWQAAFRVDPGTFSIRDEDPPDPSPVLTDVAASLQELGMRRVDVSTALLYAITYAEIALGLVAWAIWSHDEATADASLAKRAGHDTFLGDDVPGAPVREADYTAELGGARRISGLPPSVVLTVGLQGPKLDDLGLLLDDCRIVSKAFGEIEPEACGSIVPNLIMIDTTASTGQEFAIQLRAAACGRFLPVVAVAPGGAPLGADAAVDPAAGTDDWVETIRRLLP